MADTIQSQKFPFSFEILQQSQVADMKAIDGKIDPVNMVIYKDDQGDDVTPLPLYIPQDQLEKELEREELERRSAKPHNIMQTFLKMSSVVYSMAGLGSIEESKVYKESVEEQVETDSLQDEVVQATTDEVKQEESVFQSEDVKISKQNFAPSSKEVKHSIGM